MKPRNLFRILSHALTAFNLVLCLYHEQERISRKRSDFSSKVDNNDQIVKIFVLRACNEQVLQMLIIKQNCIFIPVGEIKT